MIENANVKGYLTISIIYLLRTLLMGLFAAWICDMNYHV